MNTNTSLSSREAGLTLDPALARYTAINQYPDNAINDDKVQDGKVQGAIAVEIAYDHRRTVVIHRKDLGILEGAITIA
jgi:hypothetical protein